MQLYHQNCPNAVSRHIALTVRAPEKIVRPARMRLVAQNLATSTRTYQCEACSTLVHIDTDWPEGAETNEKETLT